MARAEEEKQQREDAEKTRAENLAAFEEALETLRKQKGFILVFSFPYSAVGIGHGCRCCCVLGNAVRFPWLIFMVFGPILPLPSSIPAWPLHSLTQPREDNFGIGLFSKLPLEESEVAYIGSADVPSILATLKAEKTNFRVIATHPLPPGGRDYSRLRNEQLEELPDHLRSPLPLILLGDLNVTPWSYYFRR
jgi:hypothetical protein